MKRQVARPVPIPTPLTEPFWAAAKERQLSIQRCRSCGYYHHPPVPLCHACHSTELSFEPVSGRGAVYEYTIMRDGRIRGFEQAIPYACVAVELQEQARLLVVANLVDANPEEVRIGMPVEVTFEEIDGGFVLPQFRPAA